MNKLTLGKKVKMLMIEKEISQQKLSIITGISRSTISQFLNGWKILSERQGKEVAKVMGLNQKYFSMGEFKLLKKDNKENQQDLFEGAFK